MQMSTSVALDFDMQEKVFAFLADPGTHGNTPVRRIDTHAASVFLAGPRALKIKRAVRFPFLDYSTLAKRKRACEEEIKINRSFAPQIYLRAIPITRREDGALSIDGHGEPVEWAVEMVRFDERLTIDRVAEAGPPDRDLAIKIADVIAASHAIAPRAATDPWISSIPSIIAGNTAAFRSVAGFGADEIDALDRASQSAFSRVRKLLEQRGQKGLVRRCHGDLHLANIVLIEDKPVLFDAIEFDPLIASVDILYDLAFVIMDFVHYGRQAAAAIILNRYLATTSEDNLDALASLPLFTSMRAAIRANVLLARVGQGGSDKDLIQRTARDYFALARRLISPPPPKLVAIGGLSGTGKSVLAHGLASFVEPLPGAVVLRSDVTRKQQFQVHETDRLPAKAYQAEASAKVYQILAERAAQVLSQGHSVIVDAVFVRQAERNAISNVARDMNLAFVGLFLATDLATRMHRVGHRKGDASDATPEIAQLQEKYNVRPLDWIIIDASGTPEQTLTRSKTGLSSPKTVGS
jgi:aminoglycoside phosphotransferase family enzyme/predicted kinase